MTVVDKVRETASELKEDARDTLDHLKEEVAELRERLGKVLPFRRNDSSPLVRHEWGTMLRWPQIDVTERDGEIRVRAELPGVDEDDIDVSLSGNVLSIRGEKRSETEDRGKDHYRHECYYGSFQRTIPLPCEVERDKVEARFRKGVLTVMLPKTSEAKESVRRIPVRQG